MGILCQWIEHAARSSGAWPIRFAGCPTGYPSKKTCVWRVSEWLAATLEISGDLPSHEPFSLLKTRLPSVF